VRDFFDSVLDFFFAILQFLHGIFEPLAGAHAWGWAIIGLTLIVRVLLLPLAIKQTRSMRAMQAIQPQIKELQKKYKVDRELLKKDPETYRARRQKLSEEQMALFKREGANPAASCLPLLAQAPIFIALFWMLRGQGEEGEPLFAAPFYFFTNFIDAGPGDPTGLAATVSAAGWPGWLLILLMSGSMFITMKQMNARTAAMGSENPMAAQQKILMYVMPVFLAVISFQFPLGIVLYWVTTNIWQIAQQWIILREVTHEAETGELADKPGGSAAKKKPTDTGRRSPGASTGKKKVEPIDDAKASDDGDRPGAAPGKGKQGGGSKGKKAGGAKGKGAKADQGKATTGGSNGAKPDGAKDPAARSGNGEAKSGPDSANGESKGVRPGKRDHLPRRRGAGS
jgi:YidC/Oxa1 family membrane protein insertase